METTADQIEVRKLPWRHIAELTKILEINQDWEKLMSEIREDFFNLDSENRKYTSDDINSVRQTCSRSRRPCSEHFLEEWCSSGKRRPTVRLLLEYLIRGQFWRAADYVSEKILNEPIPERPKDGPAQTIVLTNNSSIYDSAGYIFQNDINSFVKEVDELSECTSRNGQDEAVTLIPYADIKLATNNFDVTLKLGQGAFGIAYRANLNGCEVAVKALNRFGAAHFERETLVFLRTIDHVNLLPPMAVCDDGVLLCLVYKFMSNGSLEKKLTCETDTAPLTWQQRVSIAHDITEGLRYLHTLPKPVVHRDIKTSNILLDENLTAKIADFDLIRIKQSSKTSYADVIKGTGAYMAPEAHRGNISSKMDVYSFGIVLLEILTGLPVIEKNRDHIIELTEDEVHKNGTIENLLDCRANWNVAVANELYVLTASCLLEARHRITIIKANGVTQRLKAEL